MGPIGVVFDTNVLVSALIWDGTPEQALELAFENDDIRIVHSDETIAELDRVLRYPKFESYLSSKDRLEFRFALLSVSERIDPDIDLEVDDDPDDDMFVELAVAGDAAYIVSGDDDLRRLDDYDGVRIVSPDEFREELTE